jgi:hypothetical protein
VKLKKNAETISSGVLIYKNLKKNARTINLAFLQVKLKKNAKTNSSSIFTNKIKKMPKLLIPAFLQVNF